MLKEDEHDLAILPTRQAHAAMALPRSSASIANAMPNPLSPTGRRAWS